MAGIVVEDVWFDSGGYRLKGGPTVRSRWLSTNIFTNPFQKPIFTGIDHTELNLK